MNCLGSVKTWRGLLLGASMALLVACGASGSGASGVLEEAGQMSESASPDFWLNSGAMFFFGGGFGRTIQGELPANDRWRLLYAQSNPTDTDGGFHPQNLLRLVTRRTFQSLSQRVRFRIRKDNLSSSPNRNASNGVLLFEHYQDQDNLYYAGIRVDGAAIVKKKVRGTYFTLGTQPVFPGRYDRNRNPNLIPEDREIELRSEIRVDSGETVRIQLFVDGGLVLEAVDDGSRFGGAAIVQAGLAGIRSDFMDVEFTDYRAED